MRRLPALTVIALLALAAPAAADEQIRAGPTLAFTTPSPSMDQGERLTFRNEDAFPHNVTATARGADGRPLFASPDLSTGQEALVEGSQFLTTGSYGFECTIHPSMTGTLTVTAAGTPVPRPADTRAPVLRLALPDAARPARLAKAGKVSVRVTLDEAARTALTLTVRVGARTFTVPRTASLPAATRSVSFKLPSRARELLAEASSAKLSVSGRATDEAGNRSRTAKDSLTARA